MRRFLADAKFVDDLRARSETMPASTPIGADDVEGLFVTTNTGLYILADRWIRLFRTPVFGVAVKATRHLFFAASTERESHLLRSQILGTGASLRLSETQSIWRFPCHDYKSRIHQICYDPYRELILVANTHRNSIVEIAPKDGTVVDEILLFYDQFGTAVAQDVNHINGVAAHPEALLFSAHTLGSGGGLGFFDGERVRAYSHPARGLHDVVPYRGGLLFTDSFGRTKQQNPGTGGAVILHGREFLTDQLPDDHRSLVLRGLAARGGRLFVGCSVFGERDDRFAESGGGVLVVAPDADPLFIPGPFSQTYDVLPLDGVSSDDDVVSGTKDLHSLFEREVGPCVYDAEVHRDAQGRPVPPPQ